MNKLCFDSFDMIFLLVNSTTVVQWGRIFDRGRLVVIVGVVAEIHLSTEL